MFGGVTMLPAVLFNVQVADLPQEKFSGLSSHLGVHSGRSSSKMAELRLRFYSRETYLLARRVIILNLTSHHWHSQASSEKLKDILIVMGIFLSLLESASDGWSSLEYSTFVLEEDQPEWAPRGLRSDGVPTAVAAFGRKANGKPQKNPKTLFNRYGKSPTRDKRKKPKKVKNPLVISQAHSSRVFGPVKPGPEVRFQVLQLFEKGFLVGAIRRSRGNKLRSLLENKTNWFKVQSSMFLVTGIRRAEFDEGGGNRRMFFELSKYLW
ncbi:hypothetical protein C8F04DRAFT_1178395 [Mycena alexandri]|uniref:Uncharacterized protein n=1 Tax=Mycena alexandri TaxID=1745969 RepID=A0AAD6X9N6_9AGAR|nr:hypothetical protein C8F04DRAFT_1178395 [Mycena alexandri]